MNKLPDCIVDASGLLIASGDSSELIIINNQLHLTKQFVLALLNVSESTIRRLIRDHPEVIKFNKQLHRYIIDINACCYSEVVILRLLREFLILKIQNNENTLIKF